MSVSVLTDSASSASVGVSGKSQQGVWGLEWVSYTPTTGGQIYSVPIEGMTSTGSVIALVSKIDSADNANPLLSAIVGTNVVALTFGATITAPSSLVVNIIIQAYQESG